MRYVLILCLLALAGCNTTGLTSSFCDPRSGIQPILLSPAERAALDTDTKRDILAILNFGRANCGWR